MTKRVPHVNEAGQALQTDTATKLAESLEKGLRSKDAAKAPSSGDLVPPVSPGGNSIFDRIKDRIRGGGSSKSKESSAEAAAEEFLRSGETRREESFQEKAPRKGELTKELRLDVGGDKLFVNQRKLTDRLRKMLSSIEGQDSYLKSIALKLVQKKYQGIVIDLPEKEAALSSEHEGPLSDLLGRKKKSS